MAVDNKKLVGDLLDNLKIGFSKEGLNNRKEITTYVLSSEDADPMQKEAIGANIEKLNDTVENTIRLVLSAEEYEGAQFTHAQLEAGRKIAAIALDPERAMQSLKSLTPVKANGEHSIVSAYDLGVEDIVDAGTLSTEAFDGQSMNEAVYFSIVSNIMSARQDEFGELFYPTITIDPTASGISVTTEFTSLYSEVTRGTDGSSDRSKFNKKSLIKVLYDNDVFGIDKNRVVPVKRDNNVDVLYTDYTYVENVSGEDITTSPLKFGKTIGLIGISQTDSLLAKGVMNETDSLDRTVNLQNIFYTVTGKNSDGDDVTEAFKYDVSAFPYANFVYSQQDHEKDLNLNFNTDSVAFNTTNVTTIDGSASAIFSNVAANHVVKLGMKIIGDGNVQYGDVAVYGVETKLVAVINAAGDSLPATDATYAAVKAVIDTLELKGYTLEAYRTNTNLRSRGQSITSDGYTQIYNVPVRSGLSVTLPINNASGNENDSRITSQIQALGMKVSIGAVQELVKTSKVLSAVTESGTITNANVLGVGRWSLNTYYAEDNVDLVEYVDSLTSSDRIEDIKSALVNKIKNSVISMAIDSNYAIAHANIAGNAGGKITVIIGTDPKIEQYLTSGDGKINIGSKYDVVVASTNNPLVSGKMYISFGVFDADRNVKVNPLSFGNLLYAPTISFDTTTNVGGSITRVLQNHPRYLHITNIPVLTTLNVTGLDSVIGKVSRNFHTV